LETLIRKAGTLYRWPLFDRPDLPHWHDGRTVLLGDAAHPTLPFMAQGAAMAIEDSHVLAELCRDVGPSKAVAGLHKLRSKRTGRIRNASRANMKTFHRATALSRVATYGPMWVAGHVLPDMVRARQDWIYGHDVTSQGG
jgi:salicylate hydroxylase